MGGSSQPQTTTQIQKVELPAWVEAASAENYEYAKMVAADPYRQYEGQRVAPISQGERDASGILKTGMEGSTALTNAAAGMLGRAGSYQPQQVATNGGGFLSVGAPKTPADVSPFAAPTTVQAPNGYQQIQAPGAVANVATSGGVAPVVGGQGYQAIAAPQAARDVAQAAGATPIGPVQGVADVAATRFNGNDLAGYLNPFTQNVVDTTLGGMRDNLALAGQRADDAARGAGAWGSSRSGVQQAVLQSQGAKDMAATEAGLRSAAYTDAAGRLMQDNSSALQAALANQNSGLTTRGRQLEADRANQASTLQTQALNVDVGKANQASDLQTEAQRLQAGQSNASNFLANAAQKLQGDISNQDSAQRTEALNADIGKANQASALQTAQQGLAAGTSNASNWLSNANMALQAAQGNQTAGTANNALNAGIAQGNQTTALQSALQGLQAGIANQGAYSDAAQRSLTGQTANQAAGLSAAQLGLGAGQALGGLSTDVSNNSSKNAIISAQLGSNERALEQAQRDISYEDWFNMVNEPTNDLNTRLAALGMSPYGKTTTTNETKQGGSSSNGFLSALGGVMSFLPLIMPSDPKLKKNVQTEGVTEAGVPLKSYEYKGFMGKKSPGRHIGVMADEMEAKDPSAVKRFRGPDGKSYRAVDYRKVGRGFMGRAAA